MNKIITTKTILDKILDIYNFTHKDSMVYAKFIALSVGLFVFSILSLTALSFFTIRKLYEDQIYESSTRKNLLMFLMSFVGVSACASYFAVIVKFAYVWSTKIGIYIFNNFPKLFSLCSGFKITGYHILLCSSILGIRYFLAKRRTF